MIASVCLSLPTVGLAPQEAVVWGPAPSPPGDLSSLAGMDSVHSWIRSEHVVSCTLRMLRILCQPHPGRSASLWREAVWLQEGGGEEERTEAASVLLLQHPAFQLYLPHHLRPSTASQASFMPTAAAPLPQAAG